MARAGGPVGEAIGREGGAARAGARSDERGPGRRLGPERAGPERFDPARAERRVRVRPAEERTSLARIGRLRARLGRGAGAGAIEGESRATRGLGQRLRERLSRRGRGRAARTAGSLGTR